MRGVVAAAAVAFLALGAMATVCSVGQPREPLTGRVASWTVVVSAILSIAVYWLWSSGG